jgi:hypothetical protein
LAATLVRGNSKALAEKPTERAETFKPDIQANVSDRAVGFDEQILRALQAQ